jgi:hypothetical protein
MCIAGNRSKATADASRLPARQPPGAAFVLKASALTLRASFTTGQYCPSRFIYLLSLTGTALERTLLETYFTAKRLGGHRESYMMYAVHMKRTTIFLTEDLERLLREASQRMNQPQARIVREALIEYLGNHSRPWPRSIGIGDNPDPAVTSANVKDWIRREWDRELAERDSPDTHASTC